jgi:hypothetical protein
MKRGLEPLRGASATRAPFRGATVPHRHVLIQVKNRTLMTKL